MYCRKCGKKLFDDDRFCSACGTKVLQETNFVNISDEEVVYNNVLSQDKEPMHFQWKPGSVDTNKKEQQAKHGQKSAQHHQEILESNIAGKKSDTEFVWNLHDFSNLEPKKTQDIQFNWKDEEIILKKEPLIKEIEEAKEAKEFSVEGIVSDSLFGNEKQNLELENEILKECATKKAQDQVDKIDMFYTFNKKNEEFQQLLDKEYDKIRKGRQEHSANSIGQQQPMGAAIANHQTLGSLEEDRAEMPSEAEEKTNLLIDVKAKTQNEVQSEKLAQDENEVRPEKPAQGKNEVQLEKPAQSENQVPFENKSDAKNTLLENDEILKRFDTIELQKDILGIDKEEPFSRTDALNSLFGPKINVISEVNKAPNDIESTQTENFVPSFKLKQQENSITEKSGQDNLTDQIANREDLEQENSAYVELNPKQNVAKPQYIPPRGEEPQKEGTQTRIFRSNDSNNNNHSIYNKWNYDEPKGKGLIWKIILGIIIFLFVIEGAILAIKIYAPDSALSTFLTEKFSASYQWILGQDDKKQDENDNNDQLASVTTESAINMENESGSNEVSTKPATDKAALIACQLGNNKNIKEVKANSQLSYNPTKDYGFEDINKSQPIQNNLWYQKPDGSPVYYDHSVVGSLIAFDSMWIDYVNKNDKSVIALTKEGEMAYKNALSFGEKTGKFNETFESLEIGEIRLTEKGFCVWAHEKIQIESKGKVTSKEYNWVYYLEPIEQQMKIVSYYAF